LCECHMKFMRDTVEESELRNCSCECYMKSVTYIVWVKKECYMKSVRYIVEEFELRKCSCECYMKFMRHTELKNLN
jgi:phosphopantetheinyl transferase (holo-ACP synthase)